MCLLRGAISYWRESSPEPSFSEHIVNFLHGTFFCREIYFGVFPQQLSHKWCYHLMSRGVIFCISSNILMNIPFVMIVLQSTYTGSKFICVIYLFAVYVLLPFFSINLPCLFLCLHVCGRARASVCVFMSFHL